MNYQTLKLIAIILLSLSGLSLVISVLLFARFRIISIIGDLTGRTARKQIQRIRVDNEKSGNKGHKPNAFNLARGALTDKVDLKASSVNLGVAGNAYKVTETAHPSKKLDIKETGVKEDELQGSMATDVLPVISSEMSNETTILSDGTDVLCNDTDILADVTDGTEILTNDNGTSVLNPTDELNKSDATGPVDFKIIKSVIVTHTDEEIS